MTVAAENFNFTKLVVGDLEKAAAFYTSVCGLSEQVRIDAEIEGRAMSEILFHPTAPGGGTFVLLAFHDTPKPASGELILGFVTPNLGAFVERARAAGGTVVQDIRFQPEHGVSVAFVRDIEGHLIEVVQVLESR
jgi:catechol 2,3-dioxygenase-like lactoylglutathione lyase family enzyme